MQADQELIANARSVLTLNDMGTFTKPAPRQYPHQWNWDAAVIALGRSHHDVERAQQELRSLLLGQWKDGLVPHIVYHTGASDYFPDPDFWMAGTSPDAPSVQTSGITQPPLIAPVLRLMHRRCPMKDFVHEIYPAILRWHRWFHTQRDADGSRLACLVHPWESGTDDSPRWLNPISKITPRDLPAYQRKDTVHVHGSQRPHQADYDRFIHLVNFFRMSHYDPQILLAQSPFLVQDILTNSILYRADQDLRALALEIGEPTIEIDEWTNAVRSNFTLRHWDDEKGLFYDYDVRNATPIRVNTAMTFLPLYAGLATPDQAERLVSQHLLNPTEFKPGDNARFWLTSTSQSEPAWEPRRYWRGPVWIIINWLVAEGLVQYGYREEARAIKQHSLALIREKGFWEYFDASDGSGCGSPDFSWSAALAIEFLHLEIE